MNREALKLRPMTSTCCESSFFLHLPLNTVQKNGCFLYRSESVSLRRNQYFLLSTQTNKCYMLCASQFSPSQTIQCDNSWCTIALFYLVCSIYYLVISLLWFMHVCCTVHVQLTLLHPNSEKPIYLGTAWLIQVVT